MSTRALKLPDGGTLDLPIPEGFGAPVLAMNDAPALVGKNWLTLGALLGTAALFAFWKFYKAQT